MSNLTTRAGKGSPLTNNELDANFTNLNADKVEIGGDLSGTSTAPNVAKIQGRAVSADAPENGEKLVWNGTAWEPSVDPTGEPIGHANKADSTISFDSGTRTFTIAPVAASFTVWCKGVKHTYTSAQTVVIPDTTGLHFIYFNASGVLSTQMSYFTWEEHAPTAYIYWNATAQQAVYFGDERHGITLDWQTHEYLHRTRGAAIASGFGASGYTTTGAGSTDADAQIDIGGGTFFDEDLQVDIVSTNTPVAGTWQQDLSGPARIPVLYLSGSAWVIDAPTDFPFKVVSGVPQYNLYSGGTWSAAPVANNGYFVSWILATHNLTYPVVAVISQAETNQVSEAEAMTFEGLTLSGFPSVEFRPLYKVIYQHKTSFANNIKASTIAVYDLRSISAAGVAAALVQDHGNLSGLGDDDHAQYLHVSAVRSPSAAVTNSFLPSQASQSGKYLTTDGSNPSWGTIPSGSLTFTGDVTGSGNTGSSTTLTLANSGVTAGTFTKVTVDAKGRVTNGASASNSDITTALGFTPENVANKAVANGYASLDSSGKVPSNQLPSYVDDVLEYANLAAFPGTGETGKIYVAIDSGKTYRWSGSAYVEISASPGSTDAVTEGSTNLYFTNARARAAVSASGSLSYSTSTGIFSYTQPTNVSAFTNDSGYITSSALSSYLPLSGGTLTGNLVTAAADRGVEVNWSGGVSLCFDEINAGALGATGNLYLGYRRTNQVYVRGSNIVLGADNYSSYALPLSGGTLTGQLLTSYSGARHYITDGANNLVMGLWDGSNVRIEATGRPLYVVSYGGAVTIGRSSGSQLTIDSSSMSYGGNTILHAGNYSSGYFKTINGSSIIGTGDLTVSGTDNTKLPLSGGTLTGAFTVDNALTTLRKNAASGAVEVAKVINSGGGYSSYIYIGANPGADWLIGKDCYGAGNDKFQIGSWNGYAYIDITYNTTSGTVNFPNNGAFTVNGNQVLHAGNYSSYALPLSGGTLTGSLTVSGNGNGLYFTGGNNRIYFGGSYRAMEGNGNGTQLQIGEGYSATYLQSANNYATTSNHLILHAGNYSSYALPLSGGTTTGSIFAQRSRLGFSSNDANHSIYNNYSNIDGEGGWDGMKMNVYLGLQIRTGNANGAVPTTVLDISASAVNSTVALRQGGNQVLHAGNYSSYALPLSGGTLTGTLYFTDTTNGIYKAGGRLTVRSESTDDVANFASYGLYLPRSGQTAGLYVESPIEARGGLRIGNGAGSGTISVGADTSETASRLVQRDSSGGIFGTYIRSRKNQTAGDYTTAALWTESYGSTATGIAFHISGNVGKFLEMRTNGILYWNGDTVIHSGNYNSWAPSLTGSGASGTWSINITGSAGSASNSTTVGGLTPAKFFNNMGNNHGTYTDFNSVPDFGAYYVQQGGNSPTGVASHQWYGFTLGLGNEYAQSSYASQLYWPRRAQNSDTYIYVRDREGGGWTSWAKIRAGYADTAGSVAGALANGSGGITIGNGSASEVDVAYSASGGTWQVGTNNYYGTNSFFWYRDGTGYRAGLDQSANMFVEGSSRAPIFYDYNDTGWYLDPASTSNLNRISTVRTNNWLYLDNNYGHSVVGVYASTRLQGVWAMGDSYKLAADGTSGGTLYGIAWSHPNAGGVAANLASHGMLILENGGFQGAWGGGSLRTPSDVRGTIFYDYSNTGYYCDPNSTSYLYHLILSGASYFRPSNWIQLDGVYGLYWPNHYGLHVRANDLSTYTQLSIQGNKNSYGGIYDYYSGVNGIMYDSSGNGGVYREGNGRWYFYHHVGNNCMGVGTSTTSSTYGIYAVKGGYFDGRVDGTIFYDANNTGYYCDPASTTYMVNVQATDWFRPIGGCGVYWNSYGRGIRAADNEYSYGNIGTYADGLNGWRGYGIYPNNCIVMANGSSYGFYNPSSGIWLMNSDMSGNTTFNGNVTAYSDLRLKSNVREIDNVMARRDALAKAAIKYERGGKTRIGYGAQTLVEYGCGEFVLEADDEMKLTTGLGTLSVDYGETAAVLAVASKMTDERIAVLEAELAALKKLVAEKYVH